MKPHRKPALPAPLDAFLPEPDVGERFEVTVRAPAHVVYATSAGFDLQSLLLVRVVFWLRAKLLRSRTSPAWNSEGFLADARRMGWGVLVEEPPHVFVAGASCQPWLPDVEFSPRSSADFRSYSEPNQVKIAWSLEVEPRGPGRCTLGTETRAVGTDAQGRRGLLRYWRWARLGIIPIRWLVLSGVRRRAHAQYRRAGMAND